MLTVGIILMVASIVIGILTLVAVGLLSSARSRRARTADKRSRGAQDPSFQELFGSGERGARPGSRERSAPPAQGEAQPPPRWILALATASGAGLVLGLLLVMIPSVT